jgi:hypothetical protein
MVVVGRFVESERKRIYTLPASLCYETVTLPLAEGSSAMDQLMQCIHILL